MDRSQLQQLINKYLAGSATPDEVAFLEEYYRQFETRTDAKQNLDALQMQEHQAEILDQLHDEFVSNEPAKPQYRIGWLKYAAAIILIGGISAYLWNQRSDRQPQVVKSVPVNNDVAPGGNKAVLTLADGSTIILDSAANGLLAQQAGSKIVKKEDGEIVYTGAQYPPSSDSPSGNRYPPLADSPGGNRYPPLAGAARRAGGGPASYNTMTTPRGGQYQLTLPDGTQVWLNAESSITYPTAFVGNERKVSVTGEAYFEVAHNAKKPFRVEAGSQTIEVLGTKFNVNTYKEELSKNTTLLEGSVRIKTVHTSLILQPGQQGQLTDRGLFLAANPDLEQVMAWRNGLFNFNNATLREAMIQIGRWYDVEVVYEKEIPNIKFYGMIGRDLNLSQVLKVLKTAGVNFSIDGRKLTLMSS